MMPNSGNATFTTTALAGEIDAVLIVRNASMFTRTTDPEKRAKERETETTITHTHRKMHLPTDDTCMAHQKKQDLLFHPIIFCVHFSFFCFSSD